MYPVGLNRLDLVNGRELGLNTKGWRNGNEYHKRWHYVGTGKDGQVNDEKGVRTMVKCFGRNSKSQTS